MYFLCVPTDAMVGDSFKDFPYSKCQAEDIPWQGKRQPSWIKCETFDTIGGFHTDCYNLEEVEDLSKAG